MKFRNLIAKGSYKEEIKCSEVDRSTYVYEIPKPTSPLLKLEKNERADLLELQDVQRGIREAPCTVATNAAGCPFNTGDWAKCIINRMAMYFKKGKEANIECKRSKEENVPPEPHTDAVWLYDSAFSLSSEKAQASFSATSPLLSLQSLTLEEVLAWAQSFEKLMATKHGPVVYTAYLKMEHSDENIRFWMACETYKKIASRRSRISQAKKLYKIYIQPQSPREINIDSSTRATIFRNIQEPTETCFEEAQRIVYMHMQRDSYPRFLKSEMYQKLAKAVQSSNNS